MASSLPDTQTSPRRSNFTESTYKPIIVIVSPTIPAVSESDSPSSSPSPEQPESPLPVRASTYTSLLAKISRDAHLLTITSLDTLKDTLALHGPRIAGFIIASAAILHPVHHALAIRLAALVHSNNNNNNDATSTDPSPSRIYTILFALSFPSQSISHPLLFASFMRSIFHLPWRLSGMTSQKVKTRLRASVLRKLGQRVYRVRYCVRSVFLRNVKLADKVVVATGEFPIGGQRVGAVWVGGPGVMMMGQMEDGEWDGDGDEDEDGTQTASTDEEMEEWLSEESEGTAVGGDFGDEYEDSFQDALPGVLPGAGSGSVGIVEPIQVEEDAGFLADVEDNEADVLDVHPIVTTTLVVNTANSNQSDEVLSDNSSIFTPTSFIANSSVATVSTSATTTVASSFEIEEDDDEDEDEEIDPSNEETPLSNPSLNLPMIAQHSFPIPISNNIPIFIPTPSTPFSSSSSNSPSPSPSSATLQLQTNWVPSDDEGTSVDTCCADSPIAIHEFKRLIVREDGGEEELVPCGYVGFVGHVDDSRSMSTLILGMCAVPKGE